MRKGERPLATGKLASWPDQTRDAGVIRISGQPTSSQWPAAARLS
jgi:hypothetical protein